MLKRFSIGLAVASAVVSTLGCQTGTGRWGGGPLESLARLSPATTMRESSYDRNLNGNADRRQIAPGETLTLADVQGPGAITHIWMTIAAEDPLYPRSLVLRMYWDGETEPSVESPIGDFFAVGHGVSVDVNSFPVQVSSNGRARNCYWRMPFRKSARITVTNDSPKHKVNAFYYYVDYERLPSLPKDTPCFHAQYRQEYPCRAGDYLILDAEGRGHLVGTVLSVWHERRNWFGEGDDRFYIDGAETPTLHGTGTEDYFGDAWGFRPFNQPFHGVSLWEGDQIGDRGTAYRWHIADPVRFEKSLRFTIEHKGPVQDVAGNVIERYGERNDCYSSVAFWYQTGKAKRYAAIPPVEERTVAEKRIGAKTLFDQGATRHGPGAALAVQSIRALSSPQLWFKPGAESKRPWLEVDFEVAEEGSYLMGGIMPRSRDYGDYRIVLDGTEVERRARLYSPAIAQEVRRWGVHKLSPGKHTLRFEYVGSAAESKQPNGEPGRFLGIQGIVLTRIE